MQGTLKKVLEQKSPALYAISPHARVCEAVALMVRHFVGSVVVVSTGRSPVGMFTERDVLERIVHAGRDPRRTFVGDVMTNPVTVASVNDTVQATVRLMTETRHRHVPVIGDQGIAGLVSLGDLTKWITRAQESDIRLLGNFIHGPCAD